MLPFAGVGVAIAITLVVGPWLEAPEPNDGVVEEDEPSAIDAVGLEIVETRSPNPTSAEPGTASEEAMAPAGHAHRITEGGRLSIDAASLREGEVLALGLALSDEARGDEPLAGKVVSVDGRVLEFTAVPVGGKGGGVQLAIDPAWLQRGDYMIQIKTAEKTALPLHRYVLEVR
jgi:hypothetical protein